MKKILFILLILFLIPSFCFASDFVSFENYEGYNVGPLSTSTQFVSVYNASYTTTTEAHTGTQSLFVATSTYPTSMVIVGASGFTTSTATSGTASYWFKRVSAPDKVVYPRIRFLINGQAPYVVGGLTWDYATITENTWTQELIEWKIEYSGGNYFVNVRVKTDNAWGVWSSWANYNTGSTLPFVSGFQLQAYEQASTLYIDDISWNNAAPPELDYTTLTDYWAVHYETPPENTTRNVSTSTTEIALDLTARFTRDAGYRLASLFAVLQNENNASNTAYSFGADQTGTSSVQYTGAILISGLPQGSYYIYFIYRFEPVDSTTTYWYVIDVNDEHGTRKWTVNVPNNVGVYMPETIVEPENPTSTVTGLGWFGNEIVNVLRYIFVPSFDPYRGLISNVMNQLQTKFPFAYFYQIVSKYQTIIATYSDNATSSDVSVSVAGLGTLPILSFSGITPYSSGTGVLYDLFTWSLWIAFVSYLFFRIRNFRPSE